MITRPHTQGKYTGWQGSTTSASSGTHGSTANNKAAVNGFYRGRAILAHNIQGHPIVTQTVASSNKAPTETYSTNPTQPTLGYSSKIPKTFPMFTTDELIIIGIAIIAVMVIAVVLIHG